MKKQITRISILQTSKVIAFLYFIFVSIAMIVAGIILSFTHPESVQYLGLIVMPFVYFVFIFIAVAVQALIYNWIVKWVGGIEFTVTEIKEE